MTELSTEQTEAALVEGLAEMPEDLIPLRLQYLALKDQRDDVLNQMDQIKSTFASRLKEQGLQGFLLYGKVRSRLSKVTNSRVDSKRLKDELPAVHAKYLVVTKNERVNVT